MNLKYLLEIGQDATKFIKLLVKAEMLIKRLQGENADTRTDHLLFNVGNYLGDIYA